MALLACGTLATVYGLARSLGESRVRAALIVLVLLSFSNFIERIFETRGDPLSVFFAAAALLVAARARDRSWRVVAAGVLSGLAFLATQKAVYFNFALGVALVGDATLERRFVEMGGRIESRCVERVEDVASAETLVVNCTGLGARRLLNDAEVYPCRGQIVRVRAPGAIHAQKMRRPAAAATKTLVSSSRPCGTMYENSTSPRP